VGNEKIRQPEFFLEVLHQVDDLRLNRHIECADRFIRDDDLRVRCQCARNSNALTLPPENS
jgi:hypothetical protein